MSKNGEPARQRDQLQQPDRPVRSGRSTAGSQAPGRTVAAVGGVAGILRARGGRVIVMPEQAYVLLLQVIYEHAPQIIKYAFYDMGYRAGVDLMQSLAERAADPEAAFRHFVDQYGEAGYGDLTVTHFDLATPEARLTGTNLFEAGLAAKTEIYRTPRAVDHYSRGMFAGFMSELLHREVVCEELACQFRGDPRCEFVVLPFQE